MTNTNGKKNILIAMVIILLVILIFVVIQVGEKSTRNQKEMIDRLNVYIEKINNIIEE